MPATRTTLQLLNGHIPHGQDARFTVDGYDPTLCPVPPKPPRLVPEAWLPDECELLPPDERPKDQNPCPPPP